MLLLDNWVYVKTRCRMGAKRGRKRFFVDKIALFLFRKEKVHKIERGTLVNFALDWCG